MEKHLKIAALMTGLSFGLIVPLILLHNLFSGLLPIFFILSLVSIFLFPLALTYLSVISVLFVIIKGIEKLLSKK